MNKAALGFIAGLLVAAIVCYFAWPKPQKGVIGQVTSEIQAKQAEPVIRTVYVYKDAKKSLGTSQGDEVLTAVKTKDGTATATLDTEGHAHVILTTDPTPWFGKQSKHNLSLIYGRMDHETVTRLQYRLDFIQVKKLNIGLSAGANIGGESRALVGVSLSYAW